MCVVIIIIIIFPMFSFQAAEDKKDSFQLSVGLQRLGLT